MARITSTNAEGTRSITSIEMDRPVSSVGYSNMDGTGPSVSLGFNASDEKETGRFGRPARQLKRNIRITLNEADLIAILNRIVNPNYTMGFFMGGDDNDPANRLANRVLEANGIFGEKYRHAWRKVGRDDFLYVYGVNPRHAEFQLRRIIKDAFDPAALEIERNGEWQAVA